MKFAVLGYFDESEWDSLSEEERNAFMDECFAYDDVLRKGSHIAGGEALASVREASTVRLHDGDVTVTDGPYAETKEVLGGILFLEADDMAQAVELMKKHPGVQAGPFEIRPVEDMSELVEASERRRSKTGDS